MRLQNVSGSVGWSVAIVAIVVASQAAVADSIDLNSLANGAVVSQPGAGDSVTFYHTGQTFSVTYNATPSGVEIATLRNADGGIGVPQVLGSIVIGDTDLLRNAHSTDFLNEIGTPRLPGNHPLDPDGKERQPLGNAMFTADPADADLNNDGMVDAASLPGRALDDNPTLLHFTFPTPVTLGSFDVFHVKTNSEPNESFVQFFLGGVAVSGEITFAQLVPAPGFDPIMYAARSANRVIVPSALFSGLADEIEICFKGDVAIGNIEFTAESSVIPEPSSGLLMALGGLGMIGCGWRRRKHIRS